MYTVVLAALITVPASALIYCTIAVLLIASPSKKNSTSSMDRQAFEDLRVDGKELPQLENFVARDGKTLSYRLYPCQSKLKVVLLHGSGGHSRYFMPLAGFISSIGLAQVYAPDLRGHGLAPERRGDINYIDQLEDDLSDFVDMIKRDNPNSKIIIGGHSSGGGLAIRFAGSQYGQKADAYLLISPWLKYNAPTARSDGGGWAQPYTGRIIGLTMLNKVGIHWFNGLTVVDFNLPKDARDGTETLSYSYRLNTGFAPRDYEQDLRAISQPLLVIVGASDEVFNANQFEKVFSQFDMAQVRLVQKLTHLGVVVSPAVRPIIQEWLEAIG